MIQNRTVSILGGGWLGLPLAKEFYKNNYVVKISSTSNSKIALFSGFDLQPFLIDLKQKNTPDSHFYNSETLIIAFPPGIRKDGGDQFLQQIDYLISCITEETRKIIFISSTSVYPDYDGLKSETDFDKDHPLIKAEEKLKGFPDDKTIIIIRAGGLMGYDRNPCKYIGIKNSNLDSVVNYIHRDDLVDIIFWLENNQKENINLNVCAPGHPTRKEILIKLCGMSPKSENENVSGGKIIDTSLLNEIYPFELKYPDPLTFKYL